MTEPPAFERDPTPTHPLQRMGAKSVGVGAPGGEQPGPLRELPWFARTMESQRAHHPRALPRPLRFRPITRWVRLRSGLVLLLVCVVVGLTLLLAYALARHLAPLLPPLPVPAGLPLH